MCAFCSKASAGDIAFDFQDLYVIKIIKVNNIVSKMSENLCRKCKILPLTQKNRAFTYLYLMASGSKRVY